jgi:hypothetical protein
MHVHNYTFLSPAAKCCRASGLKSAICDRAQGNKPVPVPCIGMEFTQLALAKTKPPRLHGKIKSESYEASTQKDDVL